MNPVPKKPKIETSTQEDEENEEEEDDSGQVMKDQEEALIALTEHRTKEVQHLRNRLAYYKSQLEDAEKRLEDAQLKLARSRSRNSNRSSKSSLGNSVKDIKLARASPSHEHVAKGSMESLIQPKPNILGEVVKHSENHDGLAGGSDIISTTKKSSESTLKVVKLEKASSIPSQVQGSSTSKLNPAKSHPSQEVRSSGNIMGLESGSASPSEQTKSPSQSQPRTKSQLLIPSMKPIQPVRTENSRSGQGTSSSSQPNISSNLSGMVRQKADLSSRMSSDQEAVESQAKGMKRKLEQKEHKELIPLICSNSSPSIIRCHSSSVISSQHKRKLRCLELCPTNDQLFITSALDGCVNLWQVQGKGSSANLLSTTDCASAKQRRWPEDIAWHPEGNSLFSVYTADGGDTQLSILNLNKRKERDQVIYVDEKPHVKGVINCITFMPWEEACFVTGGSDHAVVLWSEKDGENSWKPKVLHKNLHTSAVMGVAGMQHKKILLSAGADKRILGYDLTCGKTDYKHQIESKCMSILPNPCDFNLFMVQTGTPERQLRLYDIRLRRAELHAFGWKQHSSESQSALINQAWSPDGLYITSGSADPMIHVFDIRYKAHKPSQSVNAHQKRVFKAVWHYALPVMISISSDLNIGLHKVT